MGIEKAQMEEPPIKNLEAKSPFLSHRPLDSRVRTEFHVSCCKQMIGPLSTRHSRKPLPRQI